MAASTFTVGIQTLITKDGKTLRGVKPDRDGFYRKVPLMVLGTPSRNGILYEPSSVISALQSPHSRFALNLTEGNLEGEWGHPMVNTTSGQSRDVLDRLSRIDRTKVSHYIAAVSSRAVGDGLTLIEGDVKPAGPYAQYLRESMEDPNRNTAFSLRSITQDVGQQGGVTVRRICLLVTFDAVDGPGFEQASKRFMSSTEGLVPTFEVEQGVQASITSADLCDASIRKQLFSVETITNQQILDLLQSDVVKVTNQVVGVYDPKTKMIRGVDGQVHQPFHLLFGKRTV